MEKMIFDPPHLLKAFPVSNFHWGIRQNGWIHLAGQAGVAKDGSIPEGIFDQTVVALQNIDDILKALGSENAAIVSMNSFFVLGNQSLSDVIVDFVNAKDSIWPACSPVGLSVPVSALFLPEVRVEIQVIASAA